MFEYIFFDRGLRDRFADFVRDQGAEVEVDDEDGFVARVDEEIDDAQSEAIDHCYEKLLQENAELLEGTEDALEKNVAGVQFELADGSVGTVRFNPDLLARMLHCMSLEELRDFVQGIAAAVQNPDHRPMCQALRDA